MIRRSDYPMPPPTSSPRFALAAVGTGALLVGIFVVMIGRFRTELRNEIHQKMINRDAAVMYSVATQQLAESEESQSGRMPPDSELLAAVLKNARQEGMLAVAIFDAAGNTLQSVPASLLFAELPPEDYPQLLGMQPISHYYPQFRLDHYFAGVSGSPAQREAPVLEVLLPLHGRASARVLGFAQYYIDAHPLARELADIDESVNRQTITTLAIGAVLIAAVVAVAYFRLRRAQRVIAERNERLTRTNFELALSAKASALGQITSHLIHGLQGPVAGLRAVMASRSTDDQGSFDWRSATDYTERLQAILHDTVGLLGDVGADARYDLSGRELTTIIRDRSAAAATAKGVRLDVRDGFTDQFESHRGSLLCLIATNLVQNAIEATAPGNQVIVSLTRADESAILSVTDQGHGIPADLLPHLFTPGRSGRAGGTGLGLAISRLLAGQIGGELSLVSTSPGGTSFSLVLPLVATPADAKPRQ